MLVTLKSIKPNRFLYHDLYSLLHELDKLPNDGRAHLKKPITSHGRLLLGTVPVKVSARLTLTERLKFES